MRRRRILLVLIWSVLWGLFAFVMWWWLVLGQAYSRGMGDSPTGAWAISRLGFTVFGLAALGSALVAILFYYIRSALAAVTVWFLGNVVVHGGTHVVALEYFNGREFQAEWDPIERSLSDGGGFDTWLGYLLFADVVLLGPVVTLLSLSLAIPSWRWAKARVSGFPWGRRGKTVMTVLFLFVWLPLPWVAAFPEVVNLGVAFTVAAVASLWYWPREREITSVILPVAVFATAPMLFTTWSALPILFEGNVATTEAARLFGPESGNLVCCLETPSTVGNHYPTAEKQADVKVHNFVAEVVFPRDAMDGELAYVELFFRATEDHQYILRLSDSDWQFGDWRGHPNPSWDDNGSNHVRLVVRDDTGLLFLNGKAQGRLDLAKYDTRGTVPDELGDVGIRPRFMSHKAENLPWPSGNSRPFRDFTVWSLP